MWSFPADASRTSAYWNAPWPLCSVRDFIRIGINRCRPMTGGLRWAKCWRRGGRGSGNSRRFDLTFCRTVCRTGPALMQCATKALTMCLAVPGKVLTITGADPLQRIGRVSFGGIVKDVNLACVPDAKVGDYVIVHVGLAISTVD